MKNQMNFVKRSVALLLVLVMCMSMLNLTVFAAETDDVTLYPVEIASQNTDGVTVEGADGTSINGKKTIAAVSGSDDEFDITLEVTTTSKDAVITSTDAAVALVIDVSGSMDNAVGYTTRMVSAKSSAKAFLENLKKNTKANSDGTMPKRYVSLVSFSTEAKVAQDWVDIMTTNGYNRVVSAIEGLSANGGTNLEQGLSYANSQMGKNAVSTVSKDNKYTVVLTDGEPTYYGPMTWHESFGGRYEAPEGGTGTNSSQTICDKTVQTANTLKANSNAIYSVYYGDANATCYTIDNGWHSPSTKVTIKQFLDCFSTSVYSAANSSELDATFKELSQTISNAVGASASIVTDPMSSYVTFVKVTNGQGGSFNDASKTLSWDLSAATPQTKIVNGYTVSTYTLTYRVKVNRNANFYNAVKANGTDEDGNVIGVPTNGTTTLPYTLGNEKGTLEFDVPYVKSKMPSVSWKIEFYKQENADAGDYANYTNVDTKSYKGEYGETVQLTSKFPNYQDKYNSSNYEFAKVSGETVTLGLDPVQNVIKVYYNRVETSVTVNYHYTLTVIDADGTVHDPVTTDVPGTPESGLYVGDSYTADTGDSTFGNVTYTFVKAEPSKTIDSLSKDAAENVIDLYYEATSDARAAASVVVDHVYRTHTYELENGKYVLVDSDPITVSSVESAGGLKATTSYTASNEPTDEFSSYTAAADNQPTITLQAGENKITLYFDKTVDNRGDELSLTVLHRYTKTVTTIVDGEVVTTIEPKNEVGHTDIIKFYAGETVSVEKQREYNGETYEIAGDSDIINLPHPINGSEYSLHYTLIVEPAKTSVTVNHIYQTVTHETVEQYEEVETSTPVLDEDGNPVLDEDGNPVMETVIEKVLTGTETVDNVETDEALGETVTVNDLYENQKYTASLIGKNGYECQTSEADRTATVAEDGSTVIDIYYLKDNGNVDNRDKATIDVQHVYTTHVTAVVGGEVKNFDTFVTVSGDSHEGKVGDSYTAETVPTYNGEEYDVVGNPDLTKILHKGTNSTIVINYERENNQLENAAYTVNYEYYTRSMVVENGVATWGEPVLDTEVTKDPITVTENIYVGQKVELDTGALAGYSAYGSNPAATQFLTDGDNSYTFRYVKDVPLAQVEVTVNHHYTTKTLTVDGESSFTQDMPGRPAAKYVGESYVANALPVSGLVNVTVNGEAVACADAISLENLSGDMVVDFYYEVINDLRTPAVYTVQHIYRTIDWDGSVKVDSESEPQKIDTYAFMSGSASISLPEGLGYKLASATYNGTSVNVDANGTYSFTVSAGENAVVFVYERSIDTRPITSAQVIHEYYASQAALERGELESRDVESISNQRVGETIRGELKTERGDYTYAVASSSELTITLEEDASRNVITIRYVRAETTYQVIHEYYTNGTLTGSVSSTVSGQAGDTITASSIAKVSSYDGNAYTYTGASADLTLVQGENGAIVLRYSRTTGGNGGNDDGGNGGNGGGGSNPPAPPVVEEEEVEEEDVPLNEMPEIIEEIEEILDEEVPLVEMPAEEEILEEEEIFEEEVPLSEVPATGDNSGLWYAMALMSGCGLAALSILKKREK